MSQYLDRAVELRAITEIHYNCCQSVVVPFAKTAGISEDVAYKMCANFGGGLKAGATCGAIAGGLVVLGLFGVEDPKSLADYYRSFKEKHEGCVNCVDLLKINKEKGLEKKPHCDAMVYEAVELVEKMLTERGLL